jgi:hypothetical protein
VNAWLKDFLSSLHWGVPSDVPDWEKLKVTEDRMSVLEENVEGLKAIVETASSIKWGRRKDDSAYRLR